MERLLKLISLGDIGRLFVFIALIGAVYAQAQSKLSTMGDHMITLSANVQQLEHSITVLNSELGKLRVELVEVKTSFQAHREYTKQ
jgi:SMC interacting uncharacterized protein involved in chromosome segregation